jgi:hypothetical protein
MVLPILPTTTMANSYAEEEDRINSALEAYNSGKNRNLSALAREYRVSYHAYCYEPIEMRATVCIRCYLTKVSSLERGRRKEDGDGGGTSFYNRPEASASKLPNSELHASIAKRPSEHSSLDSILVQSSHLRRRSLGTPSKIGHFRTL